MTDELDVKEMLRGMVERGDRLEQLARPLTHDEERSVRVARFIRQIAPAAWNLPEGRKPS